MSNKVLIADVGGTFTRVQQIVAGKCVSEQQAPISSIDGLLDLLGKCLGASGPAEHTVLAVAAAVIRPDQANMTNWPGSPEITSQRLADAGLVGELTLLNDMHAAAIGLGQDLIHVDSAKPPKDCIQLNDARPSPGNFILVAPGTGLGAAAGVAPIDGSAGLPFKVLPIEAQHTEVPCPQEHWSTLWDELGAKLGRPPCWEDVVSGRGLEQVFGLLGGEGCSSAGDIADQADPHTSTPASQALTVYYHCAIRFCQLLALTIQPHRGIFLGGDSTRHNSAFLAGLDLGAWFVDNPVRRRELSQLPIFLDPHSRVMEGALIMAQHHAAT